jgi:hypothetical protein
MKKEIYIITSGCYSDYKIEAVFDEIELADSFMETFETKHYDGQRIEVYKLNQHAQAFREKLKPYFLRMAKDGQCTEIAIEDYLHDNFNDPPKFNSMGEMVLYVFAKDETHAIKIANEKRVELIALNRWGGKL